MKQSDAVFMAITGVFEEHGIKFEPHKDKALELLKPELKKIVHSMLYEGFKSGTIELKAQYDDKKLRSYCTEIISNFGRKDKRLNGGMEYQIQNPGSRAHVGDAVLKNLKLFLEQAPEEHKEAIQAEIDKHIAEKESKKAKKEVDVNKLPPSLRNLLR